ncbi:hypothetical protein [Xanthomonas campestris]|uniref:hypothetical protein n=1 Tax=Xanthomonas campestris TaxID=339 RepID=UPI002B221D1E|nr:hypothetical protein [Xanthomonas campestris]MEA9705251.1 hypothetical protein [Xanthomonas campestris pv. raphani]
MTSKKTLLKALENATPALDRVRATGKVQGLERAIQDGLFETFGPDALQEQSLAKFGGIPAFPGPKNGRIDIVYPGEKLHRGVELKAVKLPRDKSAPSNALYDIGQLTVDYARISLAEKLEGGELVVLVYGPFVEALEEDALLRELHNHFFLDYETSRRFGQLHPDYLKEEPSDHLEQRIHQITVIKALGWNVPYTRGANRATLAKLGSYALVSFPIDKSRWAKAKRGA